MSGFSVRLTHKVMAIGIVGLMGLLAFGAIYQIGSWSQEASRAVAKSAREISDLNKQLSIEMLEARRSEKNFQQRRNESYAKSHSELVVKIDRDFGRLEDLTKAADLGALTDKVKLAHDGFRKYAADFANLVGAEIKLGLNETLGLSGALRGAVHGIETKLKEIDEPRLTSWMLMMRRNEKDFMLRRDQKYVAEIKKSAAEFSKALSAVAIAPPVMAEIAAKLATYQKEFAAWAETAQQTAAYDASMMKTFRGFEPVMVEIAQGVERLYKEAEAAEASTRDAVRTWMLIAFALSVILVCGLSLLIGRSISNALASMVSAMTRLAGGDVADGDSRPWPARRDRRNGGCGRGVQEQHDRSRAAARRTARGRSSGRRSSARRTCANSPMRSKARSERSSRPCPRPRPNWRPRPIR